MVNPPLNYQGGGEAWIFSEDWRAGALYPNSELEHDTQEGSHFPQFDVPEPAQQQEALNLPVMLWSLTKEIGKTSCELAGKACSRVSKTAPARLVANSAVAKAYKGSQAQAFVNAAGNGIYSTGVWLGTKVSEGCKTTTSKWSSITADSEAAPLTIKSSFSGLNEMEFRYRTVTDKVAAVSPISGGEALFYAKHAVLKGISLSIGTGAFLLGLTQALVMKDLSSALGRSDMSEKAIEMSKQQYLTKPKSTLSNEVVSIAASLMYSRLPLIGSFIPNPLAFRQASDVANFVVVGRQKLVNHFIKNFDLEEHRSKVQLAAKALTYTGLFGTTLTIMPGALTMIPLFGRFFKRAVVNETVITESPFTDNTDSTIKDPPYLYLSEIASNIGSGTLATASWGVGAATTLLCHALPIAAVAGMFMFENQAMQMVPDQMRPGAQKVYKGAIGAVALLSAATTGVATASFAMAHPLITSVGVVATVGLGLFFSAKQQMAMAQARHPRQAGA